MMAFEELGVGFSLHEEIVENPEVTDLLIAVAVSACTNRSMHFVAPVNCIAQDARGYHSFLLPDADKRLLAADGGTSSDLASSRCHGSPPSQTTLPDNSQALDHDRLAKCLNACPQVKSLVEQARKGEKEFGSWLRSLDPLLPPFLRWMCTSPRAMFRPLRGSEIIPNVPSLMQFALMSSTPEREGAFQRLKRAAELHRGKGKGSLYAWHGSPTSKWHSIFRTGLKNLSNTQFMTTGAAYGQGIYMAVDSATSMGYSRSASTWDKSQFESNFRIIALCEVINHKNLKPPSPYYVVQEEEHVKVAFFFVIGCNANFNLQAADVAKNLPKLDDFY